MPMPAEPHPAMQIFTFLSFFKIFKAFIKPARVIMAVPCWSS